MTRLFHDRYYAYAAEHAWDLATGESVPIGDLDAVPAALPPLAEHLSEVLEHGRDGEPRWIVLETTTGLSSPSVVRRAADEARARGLVPIAADFYLRLRSLMEEELRHRTLMLILHPGKPLELGRQALVEAAACSPRPHVLVSFRANHPRLGESSGYVVREARAAYGTGLPGGISDSEVRLRSPQSRAPSPESRFPEDVLSHMARGARWSEFCHVGRHAAAERLLRDVAGALVRRKALVPAADALITLGRLLLERGRAADAEAVFVEAAAH
jgi:hypothetical protein